MNKMSLIKNILNVLFLTFDNQKCVVEEINEKKIEQSHLDDASNTLKSVNINGINYIFHNENNITYVDFNFLITQINFLTILYNISKTVNLHIALYKNLKIFNNEKAYITFEFVMSLLVCGENLFIDNVNNISIFNEEELKLLSSRFHIKDIKELEDIIFHKRFFNLDIEEDDLILEKNKEAVLKLANCFYPNSNNTNLDSNFNFVKKMFI